MHTHSILQSTPSPYLRIPNGTFLRHFNYISTDWLACALRLWNYLPIFEKVAIVAVDLEWIRARSIWLKLVNFMVTSSSGSTSAVAATKVRAHGESGFIRRARGGKISSTDKTPSPDIWLAAGIFSSIAFLIWSASGFLLCFFSIFLDAINSFEFYFH